MAMAAAAAAAAASAGHGAGSPGKSVAQPGAAAKKRCSAAATPGEG